MIADLRDLVVDVGIHHGIATALDSKLRAALAALEAGRHHAQTHPDRRRVASTFGTR